jgi:ABC-type multidrug transport system fused ATPase/permease subunit
MKFFSDAMFFVMQRTAWRHAESMRARMVLFYALFLTANIAISFQPVALAAIINAAQRGGPDAMHKALMAAAAYGGLTLLFWALHGPARIIERRVAFTVYRNFVTSLYRKVTEMPLRWHQDHHSGSTINRVNKAGKALFNFSQGQFVPIQTTVRLVTNLVMLTVYSRWVGAASLLSCALIVYVVRRLDVPLRALVRTTNERDHHLNAALYDYVGNIITVLTLRLQGNTRSEIGRRFDAMKPSFWKETLVNERKWGAVNLLLIGAQAGIIGAYVGFGLAKGDALALGSVVAIFQYLLSINLQFFQGMLTYGDLLYQHTDVRGVDGLLADHARLGESAATHAARSWRRIDIEELTFTHDEGEDALHHLRGIRMGIEAGQKVALIGSSGSGKTTLLTLLRGLYDAQRVRMEIDGEKFDNLQPLSGFTTLVPQDAEIFENTVLYNLTLGTEVPDDMVQQALAITTFADVAPHLPQGLATDIRERGVNLSGGQKQRLALARGLIAARDSSLLLLDEPTSSVDLPTESVIFDRLFAAFRGKAIVASIHRLHLLPRFDRIVFMRDGTIIEQGPFNELIAQRGAFYHLWQQHLSHSRASENAVMADA